MKKRKLGAIFLTLSLSIGLLTGCGNSNTDQSANSAGMENSGEKVFTYGDTTFNAENDESIHTGDTPAGPVSDMESEKRYLSIRIPWNWNHGWQNLMKMWMQIHGKLHCVIM